MNRVISNKFFVLKLYFVIQVRGSILILSIDSLIPKMEKHVYIWGVLKSQNTKDTRNK